MAIELESEYDKIYRYCYFHVKDQYLAEDLTQETFLRYFKRQTAISHSNHMGYLYTIARNLCIDFYRRPKVEQLTSPEEKVVTIDFLEEKMDIKTAVSALSKDLQEVLMLRYSEELSVGEAAKVMELSRFALYRREKEALNLLKKQLEGGNNHEY